MQRFVYFYRGPVLASAIALAGVASVAIGGQMYVNAHQTEFAAEAQQQATYEVLVNGEPIGTISSTEKVEQWLAAKSAELRMADTPLLQVLDENQVTYRNEKAYKETPDDEATLARLASAVRTHPVGVELIVGGKVLGVVRDQGTADELLKRIKEQYVQLAAPAAPAAADANQPAVMQTAANAAASTAPTGPVTKVAGPLQSLAFTTGAAAATPQTTAAQQMADIPDEPQREVTSVQFEEEVATKEVPLTGKQLSDPEDLYKLLATGNPTPVIYTVKAGDCISCIAEKLNIPSDVIYDKNPWIEDDKLQIGDELDLTELQPLLNVKSVEQITEREAIEAPVEYQTSDDMRVGQSKVLREGTDGEKLVTYRLVKRNGSLLEEEIVHETILKEPVARIVLKGSKVIKGEGTGKFRWPVLNHRITSYQGQRWGRLHKGLDMVGNKNIMAADSGVVVVAAHSSGGLGNTITIDHKNGFKTVYGHMKSLKVKKGDVVQKGDVIGIMGSTGHSTGTHLHFEIYLNGKLKNPTSYL